VSLHPLAGHERLREPLAQAVLADSLPAALLLHGMRGVGKQRTALWLAQAGLCREPGPQGGCGSCRDCAMALRLQHPDLHWFVPLPRPRGYESLSDSRQEEALEDARGEFLAEYRADPLRPVRPPPEGREGIRAYYLGAIRTLRRRALRSPSVARRQFFVLSEAELLVPQAANPEAANALLKLLEEPPPSTFILLTTSRPGRILGTIRSRTVPLHLAPLAPREVEEFLVRVIGRPREEAGPAALMAEGSIGEALGFLPEGEEPGPLEELRRRAVRLLRVAVEGGRGDFLSAGLQQQSHGARTLEDLLTFLERALRDLAAVAAGTPGSARSRDLLPWMEKVVRERELHPARVARAREAVDRARWAAAGNLNPQLFVPALLREVADTLSPPPPPGLKARPVPPPPHRRRPA